MNVVHVSTTDSGGAGNVARSLTIRLNDRDGIESTFLVNRKTTDYGVIQELPSFPFERILNYGIERIASLEGLAAPSSFRLRQKLRSLDADVVHLHNLHGGYFNLLSLLTVPPDIQIVWTFHDMWPFTGNCVYARGCNRFQESCGSCPQTDTYPSLLIDTTPLLLRLKQFVTNRLNITAVCPSEWICDLTEQSQVEFAATEHIPNGVDTDRFSPHKTRVARKYFDVPDGDQVLLFLAHNLDADRKGMDKLLCALENLPNKDEITLLVIGGGNANLELDDTFNVRAPGYVLDEELPLAYSAADLFIIPSLAENFPLTVLESMACGTPVVGFPTGGISEQIVDGETGWLCPDTSAIALAETIQRGFDDEHDSIGAKARDYVKERYSLERMVRRYLSVYPKS